MAAKPSRARRVLDTTVERTVGRSLASEVQRLESQLEVLAQTLGGQESARVRALRDASLQDAEFRIYSQWGEDGIIQHLVGRVPIGDPSFVEIGVEDYREANTRFLLVHDNWRGLAVDASTDHERFIRSTSIGWRHAITPVVCFVTRDNINQLLRDHGFADDLGLLSIDVDGNDYWLLDALEPEIRPRIVVVEYNALFGPDHAVSIPYDPHFAYRTKEHTGLYFGASLAAHAHWAERAGYVLTGCSSNGANAFFIRGDLAGDLPALTPAEAWRPARFRLARDEEGRFTYLDGDDARLALIASLPIVDVRTGDSLTVGGLRRSA